jgi:MFS family permease
MRRYASATIAMVVCILNVAKAMAQDTGDSPPLGGSTANTADWTWLYWLTGIIALFVAVLLVAVLVRSNLMAAQTIDEPGWPTHQGGARDGRASAYESQRQAVLQPRSTFPIWPTALAALILAVALYAYFSASSSYNGWWVPVVYVAFITLDLAWLIYGIVMFVRGIGKGGGQMFSAILIIASAIAGPYLLFIAGLLTSINHLGK